MRKLFWILFVGAVCCVTSCSKKENASKIDQNEGDCIIKNAVTDIDGNQYDAVKLGKQVWMASNLKTTRYANGYGIPLGNEANAYEAYRYFPNNDESLVSNYGYLYNWAAIMHGANSNNSNPSGVKGICPDGWHVPSFAEWWELLDYLKTKNDYLCDGWEGSVNDAKALAANYGWKSSDSECAVGYNQSSNNLTGFSALPAGIYQIYTGYSYFGMDASFWSCTECESCSYNSEDYEDKVVWARYLNYDMSEVDMDDYRIGSGLSVRCVRD